MGDIVQGVGGYLSVNLLDTLLGRWYAIAMNKKLSAAKQKRAKTYYRNLLIKTLHSQGKSEAGIGRSFGLSRQRIFQILQLNKKRWYEFWKR